MEALKQATIRVIAVIAEGVPEKDTKTMIAYARTHNKVIIGPATVGGVQVRIVCVRKYKQQQHRAYRTTRRFDPNTPS